MGNIVGMQVREGQRYVVAEVDLGVKGERGGGSFQEGGEVSVHQLHEDGEAVGSVHVGPEVLHDMRMLHGDKPLALLLQRADVGLGHHQKGVQYFGGAQEVITLSLAHQPVGPVAEQLVF